MQKNKPKISVVVCTRNEEKTIGNCLEHLKKQEIKTEIIIVDAHSRDKTRDIAKRYTKKFLFDHGKGLSDARNVGWKAANADIIAYCDADCRPGKEWAGEIVKTFENTKVVAVSGPLSSYDGSRAMKFNIMIWANWMPRILAKLGYSNVWGANMAFRKEALKKIPFRLKFLEDFDMSQRMRAIGKVKFNKNVKMNMSSRRFEKGFYITCFNFYIKALFEMKIMGKYDGEGYYAGKK